MRIFDVRDAIERIFAEQVDPETGEIQDAALDALNALNLELDTLALELAAYAVGERVEAEAVAEQAKRLAERAKRHERRADWIEGVIARNVEPGRKLHDARVTIGWRKSTAVKITDEAAIPDELFRYSRALDKAEIAKRLKAGEEVKGAELEHRQNLVVK